MNELFAKNTNRIISIMTQDGLSTAIRQAKKNDIRTAREWIARTKAAALYAKYRKDISDQEYLRILHLAKLVTKKYKLY